METNEMTLAKAMWDELEKLFDSAISEKRHLTIRFDAYENVTATPDDQETVMKAICKAEERVSRTIGTPVKWTLPTLHYFAKFAKAHGGIQKYHYVSGETDEMVDYSAYYEFSV